MMEMLDALLAWTSKGSGYARAVIWAHNSHVGDARATQMGDFFRTADARGGLAASRLERAVGVVYKPETERASHYFQAGLADQFDAVIHVDTTGALTPLERWSREDVDLPETYPTGV